MELFVLILHIVAALSICGLVLIQHGKGADVGAAFGSGASGTVFGATGSANFLSRATAIMALVFFLTSLGLTYFSSRKSDARGVMADHPTTESRPAQIPPPVPPAPGGAQTQPQPQAPAAPLATPPQRDDGSKAQDVPK